MITNSELLSLRVLVAVVEEASVSRAALRLHVTQPAVSNALARLRVRLNDPLFVKVGRHNVATERARHLVQAVAAQLQGIESALGVAAEFDPARTRQRFTLGLPDYLETLLAPELLARTLRVAPHASLSFRRASAESLSAALDGNQIDLALSRTDALPRWQNARKLFDERFVVLHSRRTLAPTTRLSLAQFLSRPHAMVSFTGQGPGQMDAALAAKGKERTVVALASSFSALGAMVARAPVIASVPHPIGQHLARVHRLCASEIGFAVAPIPISLVRIAARTSDTALNWFSQLVVDSLDACRTFDT